MLCVIRYRSLRRANYSSRGVLPTAARRCVLSRNLMTEEALAQWGLLRQKQNQGVCYVNFLNFFVYIGQTVHAEMLSHWTTGKAAINIITLKR